MTEYEDFDGLGSLTDYTSLAGQQLEAHIDNFVDEANNTVPYTKQQRDYGDGLLRIGTSINLTENIYTLAFIAELNNELIDEVTLGDSVKMPEGREKLRTTPKGTVIGVELGDGEEDDVDEQGHLENEAAILKWEEATLVRYEGWKQERIRLHVHVFICSASQIILIVLLFGDAAKNFDFKAVVKSNVKMSLLTAKAICAMILHLAM